LGIETPYFRGKADMNCPERDLGWALCQKFFSRMALEIHLMDVHGWSIKEVEEYIHGYRSEGSAQ